MKNPDQAYHPRGTRPERVLLLSFYDPTGISTVPETVAYMQKFSKYSVTSINLCEHRADMGYLKLQPGFRLDDFQAIIIHNTVAYNALNLLELDSLLDTKFRDFKGVKVIMKQDENHMFRDCARFIGEAKFDLVSTCLPLDDVHKVYDPAVVGDVRFMRMFTGYITPTLRALYDPSYEASRQTDIAYRGSTQPLNFGMLAYEKRKIGSDVASRLEGANAVLDISSRWEDRIGTGAWFDFLLRAKAVLGAESGASIFDLDGDLDQRCQNLVATLGPESEDPAYCEAFLAGLADLEYNIKYNQISPRHFEAAATKTLQIMYPGQYSDVFVAGQHFLALERDYSNLSEVLAIVQDDAARTEITERAYREIVLNVDNWIETFVARLDDQIDQLMRIKKVNTKVLVEAFPSPKNVLIIAGHDPSLDPRLSWIENGAPHGMKVHQLGSGADPTKKRIESTGRGNILVCAERVPFTEEDLEAMAVLAGESVAGRAALAEIYHLHYLANRTPDQLATLIGAPREHPRIPDLKWYFRYFLTHAKTLASYIDSIENLDAIIATDLDTLIPALLFKARLGIPVIYDAHEYWAESDLRSIECELPLWLGLEKRLVQHVDHAQTVSTSLAEIMTDDTGVHFHTLPNCETIKSLLKGGVEKIADDKVRFLFQGNFAAGRGLELLIDAWPHTAPQAILELRGPDNAFKDEMIKLAQATGLMDERILFPPAVAETELVHFAARSDVGLIPYTPAFTVYKHCCPNKMSQYMAAGIPILANDTVFVSRIVTESQSGIVTDFSKRHSLVAAVNELVESPAKRSEFGQASQAYFEAVYNWENQSSEMMTAMQGLIDKTRNGAVEVRKPFRLYEL
jgi:glycosyltransferase involved in cell wall biosynthesis